MIRRTIETLIRNRLFKGRAIIVLGARQVGKTTVLKKIASELDDVLWMNADDMEVQSLLSVASARRLQALIAKKQGTGN